VRSTDSLTIRAGRAVEVDMPAERALDGDTQSPELLVHGGAVLRPDVRAQHGEQRLEPPHDLDGRSAVLSDLGHSL